MAGLTSAGLIAGLLLATGGTNAQMTVDVDRAVRNYNGYSQGALRLSELTPAERAEVLELARQLEHPPGTRLNPNCTREEESRPRSDLDQAVWRLKCGR